MPFSIIEPTIKQVPILLSVPHCGIEIPEDLRSEYCPKQLTKMDDTDWFVDRLYDFAPQMGITMICAKYSRWLIDLNRDSKNVALYDDGRIITELTPTKNFLGESLYATTAPSDQEVKRRLDEYYFPYHNKIKEILHQLREQHAHVLFFDAHSIRQVVPTIHPQAFPDLILGNQDGKTAANELIECAFDVLQKSSYSVSHNYPFKGGALTRSFGKPETGVHALQLEMTKKNYMDDSEINYHLERATAMRTLLQNMFSALIDTLKTIGVNQ